MYFGQNFLWPLCPMLQRDRIPFTCPERSLCLGITKVTLLAVLFTTAACSAPEPQAVDELVIKIHKAHNENRRVYDRPRIHAELKDEGALVDEKRVGRPHEARKGSWS